MQVGRLNISRVFQPLFKVAVVFTYTTKQSIFIFSVFFPYHENNWSVGVTAICNSSTDPVFPHCDSKHCWTSLVKHVTSTWTLHPPRPVSPCWEIWLFTTKKENQSLYPVSVSALTCQRAETKDDKDGKAVIVDKEKKSLFTVHSICCDEYCNAVLFYDWAYCFLLSIFIASFSSVFI